MYTRIALGKNAAMDVVSGESSGAYGQLFILYPMLFALQAFQLLIGAPAPCKMQSILPALRARGVIPWFVLALGSFIPLKLKDVETSIPESYGRDCRQAHCMYVVSGTNDCISFIVSPISRSQPVTIMASSGCMQSQ